MLELSFDFISKMYNHRNSYAEVFTIEELKAIHISSIFEDVIKDLIKKKKFILLTGNPGDGKTHLIRVQNDFLIKNDTFIELDINEVPDHSIFLKDLKTALLNNRPAIIAINEYPLYELLKNMDEDFPYKKEILEAKEHSIIYGDECKDYGNQKVAVIDLNNRNLLSYNALENAFSKLLNNITTCKICGEIEKCFHNQNLNALRHSEIQHRVIKLISLLGNIGNHAVMRDILGLIAFILTDGKKCTSVTDRYYDLLFKGNNSLFKEIESLNPSRFSHPIIDDQLWNGLIKDGWYLNSPSKIPNNIEDTDEAMEVFLSIKRKYFFEHKDGINLLSLYPKQLSDFLDLLRKANDDEVEILQKVILSINRFYNPKENENQKLYIWNNHSYESKKYLETIISNRSIPFQNMQVLVPKLPLYLKTLDYGPNHFILRVDATLSMDNFVDLKINFELFKMLMLIAEGYPPQILPKNHKFTIEKFMYKLSAKTNKNQTNEFIVRSVKNNNSRKIIIKDGKYLLKSR